MNETTQEWNGGIEAPNRPPRDPGKRPKAQDGRKSLHGDCDWAGEPLARPCAGFCVPDTILLPPRFGQERVPTGIPYSLQAPHRPATLNPGPAGRRICPGLSRAYLIPGKASPATNDSRLSRLITNDLFRPVPCPPPDAPVPRAAGEIVTRRRLWRPRSGPRCLPPGSPRR